MQCKSVAERNIPPFYKIWDIVQFKEKWSDILNREMWKERKGGRSDIEIFESVELRAKAIYDRISSILSSFFEKGETVDVFRSISVEDTGKFIDDVVKSGKSYHEGVLQGVGIFWAWDIESAVSYRGGYRDEVILEAAANCEDVDFEGTIIAFLMFSEGSCDPNENENELRLKKGRKMPLRSVYKGTEGGKTKEALEPNRITFSTPVWVWT